MLLLTFLILSGCAKDESKKSESGESTTNTIEDNQDDDHKEELKIKNDVTEKIIYENDEYGFSLEFPETWTGYTTQKRQLSYGHYGTRQSIDFGFPEQDSLFNISMHTKEQWNELQNDEGPKPTSVGENNDYIFGYSVGQYAANEEMMERMKEVQQIVKTFKFTNN